MYEVDYDFKGKVPKTLRNMRLCHEGEANFDNVMVMTFNDFVLFAGMRAQNKVNDTD